MHYIAVKCLSSKTFSCSDVSRLIKSISKSIGVKLLPILFEKVLVLVSAILSTSIVNKPADALVGPIFTLNTSFDVDLRKAVHFGG